MTLLIESPWLGLLPAVLFLAAYRTSRKRLALVAGLGWLGYSVYEYGMSQRWLCSGECNIRIDLLLIYTGAGPGICHGRGRGGSAAGAAAACGMRDAGRSRAAG